MKLKDAMNYLKKWKDFVSSIEGGYDDSIYEYTNDLCIRDRLQKMINCFPQPGKNELSILIKDVDDLYINVTLEIKKPILRGWGIIPMGWWWFRIPKKLNEELKNDLINSHLIQ
jgi:hypothetical protein